MKDKIIDKLSIEIKKYPKHKNQSSLSSYCLDIINKCNGLSRYERGGFSEILSRWVLEERLEQHKETKELMINYFLKIIKKTKLPTDKGYRYSNEYIENWVEQLKENVDKLK